MRTRVCSSTINLQTWSAGPAVAALIPGAEPILRVLKSLRKEGTAFLLQTAYP